MSENKKVLEEITEASLAEPIIKSQSGPLPLDFGEIGEDEWVSSRCC